MNSKEAAEFSNTDKMSFKFESASNMAKSKRSNSRPPTAGNKENNKELPQPPKITKNKSSKNTYSKPKTTPTNSTASKNTMQETNFNAQMTQSTSFPFKQLPNSR